MIPAGLLSQSNPLSISWDLLSYMANQGGPQAQQLLPTAPMFQYGGVYDPYGVTRSIDAGASAHGTLRAVGQLVPGAAMLFGVNAPVAAIATPSRWLTYMSSPFFGAYYAIRHAFGASNPMELGKKLWEGAKTDFGSTAGKVLSAGLKAYAGYKAGQFLWRTLYGNWMTGLRREQFAQRFFTQQFDFYNPYSRAGMGFSLEQARELADYVREESSKDPFLSEGEAYRLLQKMKGHDMLRGVHSVKTFKQKFSETLNTVRELAKFFNTTMEEALDFFDSAKRMGLFSKKDMLRMLVRTAAGAGSGLTSAGIMRSQAEGATIARSMGMLGKHGAQTATHAVMLARDMLDMGLVSQDEIIELSGGLKGEKAYQAIGRKLQQAAYRLTKSNLGRVLYAALGEQKDGRFTGRMDEKLAERFRTGNLTAQDIRRLAEEKLRTREAKLSFLSQEEYIAGAFTASVGAEGWGGVLALIRSMRGGKLTDDEAAILLKRLAGLGIKEVQFLRKAWENQELIAARRKDMLIQRLRKRLEKAELAQNASFAGLMRQLKAAWYKDTVGVLQDWGRQSMRTAQDIFLNMFTFYYNQGTWLPGIDKESAYAIRRMFAGLSPFAHMNVGEGFLDLGKEGYIDLTTSAGKSFMYQLSGGRLNQLGMRVERDYGTYAPLLRLTGYDYDVAPGGKVGRIYTDAGTFSLRRVRSLSRYMNRSFSPEEEAVVKQALELAFQDPENIHKFKQAYYSTRGGQTGTLFEILAKTSPAFMKQYEQTRTALYEFGLKPGETPTWKEELALRAAYGERVMRQAMKKNLPGADILRSGAAKASFDLEPFTSIGNIIFSAQRSKEFQQDFADLLQELSGKLPLDKKTRETASALNRAKWESYGWAGAQGVGAAVGAATTVKLIAGGIAAGFGWTGIGLVLAGLLAAGATAYTAYQAYKNYNRARRYGAAEDAIRLNVSSGDVMNMMATPEGMKTLSRLTNDPEFRMQIIREEKPGSKLYVLAMALERIQKHNPQGFKKLQRLMRQTEAMKFVTSLRRLAPELQAEGTTFLADTDRGTIFKYGGKEIGEILFGGEGITGLGELLSSATAENLFKGRGLEIGERLHKAAQLLSELQGERRRKVLQELRKTETGRRLIKRERYASKKYGELVRLYEYMSDEDLIVALKRQGLFKGMSAKEQADAVERIKQLRKDKDAAPEHLQRFIEDIAERSNIEKSPQYVLLKVHQSLEKLTEAIGKNDKVMSRLAQLLEKGNVDELKDLADKGTKETKKK